MRRDERDRMVLSLLEPRDRAEIDAIVEAIIVDELTTGDAIHIEEAAHSFDARAEDLPDEEKLIAWMIAAALRERAGASVPLQ